MAAKKPLQSFIIPKQAAIRGSQLAIGLTKTGSLSATVTSDVAKSSAVELMESLRFMSRSFLNRQ
jgi:hypothetical protein